MFRMRTIVKLATRAAVFGSTYMITNSQLDERVENDETQHFIASSSAVVTQIVLGRRTDYCIDKAADYLNSRRESIAVAA